MCSRKLLLYSISFITFLIQACIYGYDSVYKTTKNCPRLRNGPSRYFYGSRCYSIHIDMATWQKGRRNCESHNGRLAKVDDENLLRMLGGHKSSDSGRRDRDGLEATRWIGAIAKSGGTFVWTDESPVRGEILGGNNVGQFLSKILSFSFFSKEECLVLGNRHYESVREKRPCHLRFPFICEYDVDHDTKVTVSTPEKLPLSTKTSAVLTTEESTTPAPTTLKPTGLSPVFETTAERSDEKTTASTTSGATLVLSRKFLPLSRKPRARITQKQGVFTLSGDHTGKFLTAEHTTSFLEYSMMECTAECNEAFCAVLSYNALHKLCRLFSDSGVLNEETLSVEGWSTWVAAYQTL